MADILSVNHYSPIPRIIHTVSTLLGRGAIQIASTARGTHPRQPVNIQYSTPLTTIFIESWSQVQVQFLFWIPCHINCRTWWTKFWWWRSYFKRRRDRSTLWTSKRASWCRPSDCDIGDCFTVWSVWYISPTERNAFPRI